LATIPIKLRISEIITIDASKQLKKSTKNIPEDANTFSTISIKKNVKKEKSIVDIVLGSVSRMSEKVKSNKMKTA
jgi:hypothetical protein